VPLIQTAEPICDEGLWPAAPATPDSGYPFGVEALAGVPSGKRAVRAQDTGRSGMQEIARECRDPVPVRRPEVRDAARR